MDACIEEGVLDETDLRSALVDVSKKYDGNIDDLAFGDLVNILALPSAWAAIGRGYDQGVLVDRLNRVARLRNKVMHFRKQDTQDELRAALLPSIVNVLNQLKLRETGIHS